MYLGDYTEDYATLNCKFLTLTAADVPTTLAGTPVISVYKANDTTQSTAGITLSVDFDAVTGTNNVLIDLSSDAFYAIGSDYQIVVTTGTVSGVSWVGRVVGQFSIQNRYDAASSITLATAALGSNADAFTLATGVETLTYTATHEADGTLHEIAQSGGTTDGYYSVTLDGNEICSAVSMQLYVQSNADTVQMQFYHWGDTAYKTERVYTGSNNPIIAPLSVSAIGEYTGTGSDIGKVRFRFLSTTTTNIAVDRLIFEHNSQELESGFENGMVWVDTAEGQAGTAKGIGIATNSVLTLTDAITIASNNKLHMVYMSLDSTFAPAVDFNNYNVYGVGYTCNLGGYDYAGTHIYHASPINGIATTAGVSDHFDILSSIIDVMTSDDAHFTSCIFKGTYTFGTSGIVSPSVNMNFCVSGIAGAAAPVFTKTAGATLTLSVRGWRGGYTLSGLEAGDVITLDGCFGTITLNGADATVDIRGVGKPIANNLTGSPTVTTSGYVVGQNVADILADTAYIQPKIGLPSADLSQDIAAIYAKTNLMTFTNSNELDSNTKSINDATVTGSGTTSDPWDGS